MVPLHPKPKPWYYRFVIFCSLDVVIWHVQIHIIHMVSFDNFFENLCLFEYEINDRVLASLCIQLQRTLNPNNVHDVDESV